MPSNDEMKTHHRFHPARQGIKPVRQWLTRTPLRVKIASVLAVGSIASIVIGIVGYAKLGTLHRSVTNIVDRTVVEINLGLNLNRAIVDVDRAEKNIILAESLDAVSAQEALLKRYKSEVKSTIQDLRRLVDGPLRSKLDEIDSRFDQYIEVQQHIVELVKVDFLPSPTSTGGGLTSTTPTYERLVSVAARLAQRCSLPAHSFHRELCVLMTGQLLQDLKTVRDTREGLLLSESLSPSTTDTQATFSDAVSKVYFELNQLAPVLNPQDHASLSELTNAFSLWLFSTMRFSPQNDGESSRQALAIFRGRTQKLADEINGLTQEIVAYIDNQLNNEKKSSKQVYRDGAMILLSLSVLCIALSFIFGFRTLSQLSERLRALTLMARKVATGDMSARTTVDTNDQLGELGESLNMMAVKISDFTDELKQSRRHAEAANLMKSQFLANMSHEIRTPMNGVLGMTELMSMTKLSRVQRRYLDRIRESGDVLLALVNDILDFSKIEADKLDLDHSDFDLFKTIEDVAAILAHRAQSKGLELVCDIDPAVIRMVTGDPARLRQIILNLLSNAVKFTDKGEVTVTVRSEALGPRKQRVKIQVQDSGIGIDDETKDHLFRPFVQADSSTTRTFGGTGLGLAITKRLVELMGGEIDVTSALGAGSNFSIQLPFQLASEPRPTDTTDWLRGKKFLLVDDNASALATLSKHLRHWGADIVTASTALEALNHLRRGSHQPQHFDVALIDLDMPTMDGSELVGALSSLIDTPCFHAVMLTPVCINIETERRLRHPLIASQIAKPLRLNELRAALEISMDPSRAAAVCKDAEDQNRETGPAWVGENDSQRGDDDHDDDEFSSDAGNGRRGSILIAEDNVINQDVAVGLLSLFGYQVEIARNGREAVAMMSVKKYDAILMDCQMPEMDGYRAASEIRRVEQGDHRVAKTPIIAMTASAFRGDRERCLAAGMDDYMAKPVTHEKLSKVLQKWLPVESDGVAAADASGLSHELESLPGTTEQINLTHIIDPDSLQQIRDIEEHSRPGFFVDIVDIFCKSADEHIDQLTESITRGDLTKIEREAHFIKGSAGNFGARRVIALCQQIESLARVKNIDGVPELEKQLIAEYHLVKAELQRMTSSYMH